MGKPLSAFSNVRGILCDIDGTLTFKGSPIPGTIETLSKLRAAGKELLFLTNTDCQVPTTMYRRLIDQGFSVEEQEIFTPIIALQTFLQAHQEKKIFLVASKEVEEAFNEFKLVSNFDVPDYVIVADFRDEWNVHRLNQAFKYLLKGAALFGTQGNRYCLNDNGEPQLDTGSFVRMLADAAGVEYTLFGKPSKAFFMQALTHINLHADECVVVGDDVESDIQGATNAGLQSVLVRTGKAKHEGSLKTTSKPLLIIDTFKLLSKYL